ncbi:putative membrane protein [Halarchaeum rubridurum]|uniref:Putative membrane protein n=1 Tax=Halarchaeum rubridurum TaxID=489911 RepID=A0A830G211_9EURY|nr:SHOCT domain-containing protein [Halarchaeum rubridurum]MBP1955366.1 putative membrane protein [Halarchaeum rubridurum]GGM71824.1 hypothetical protein GCM10009017_22190 [Halarchaeum rubridurum]
MEDWLKAVVGIGVVLLALPLLGALFVTPFAMGGAYGGMHGGGMYGGMYGGGTGGWLLGLLVPLALLLGLGYVAYRVLGVADEGEDGSEDAALTELRAAYARGDLTTEEYEERRDRLGESRE